MKKRNIIKLFGEITQETVDKVYEQVLGILEENEKSGITPVYILINSISEECATEDNFYAGVAIRNCLKLLPNKLVGAVIAFSDEVSNIIFMDCDKKLACPNSKFIFTPNMNLYSESFKKLKNYDSIINSFANYDYWVCEKDEIFESGLADHKLTSFEQLFAEEKTEDKK